jgi:DsbC/DsbD-like thiol-disulfide interchange protein
MTSMFLLLAGPSHADRFSHWDIDTRSAARLLEARSLVESGITILRAGVQIKLQPGWKTYWRYPGDSGVPAVFDFSRSENIESIDVLWPEPEHFTDGASYAVGYRDGVVLPLRVVPLDEKKPVTLHLYLDYAVCENLCMIARAKVELVLTGEGDEISEAILSGAEALVPNNAPGRR